MINSKSNSDDFMNTINIIIRATRLSPFRSHHSENVDTELAHFAVKVNTLISAEKIMSQRSLLNILKQFIKDNYLKDIDVSSALRLESQLNSLGEFCISLNKEWFKHYFIVKVDY